MRTHVLALLAALLLLMCLGAGTATAQEQVAGQESGSEQTANSEANAVQVAPSNRNVDVRIWSEGDSGGVEQTNAAGAAAVSGNSNQTDQSASQDQSGAGTQVADQGASNEQYAGAEANGVQVKPSNDNVVVRIDSPGKDGPVEQTNAAGALAAAGNDNSTTQSADQEQGGGHCCKDGGGTQIADQKAHNDQDADAEANAVQIKPSNKNVSVRIDSPGDNGPVKQTNAALAGAAAGNANETTQSADQSQDGGCKCGGGLQVADQKAKSEQDADAEANAVQIAPSNKNTSVRIDSKGDDGPVKQTNVALAGALAGNANDTDQSATQSQGGGGDQIADQSAYNDQDADAKANAIQKYPSNDNTSVRVGSPGSSGSVTQTNAALAGAVAVNHNDTTQSADQYQAGDSCKCHGGGLQVASQKSDSEQDADADANAIQVKPSNSNTAVDLGGKKQCGCPKDHGGGGDVEQTNVAGALGIALNGNSTDQSATQDQGDSCKCHGGDGVQVAAQSAYNDQDAYADANAVQVKPSNDNTSVGGSGGGSVSQTNAALAGAVAGNLNETTQSADQSGGGVQVIAQKSDSEQDADADANAIQLYPYNGNTSVGGSGGGSVSQTNAALAGALAGNLNTTYQSADQSQDGGSCKCGGGGEQIVAQSAYNDQYAGSEANAVQKHPSNSNTPVHIGGGKKQCGCPKDHGGGGDVEQANIAAALGIALNANSTDQSATQSQRGDSCKCHGGGLQVAAQKAKNKQDADASANALQFGASNSNSPVRIWSTGGSGSVRQANLAKALGIAANLNKTKQEANQTQ